MTDAVAVFLFVGVIAYAVLGGADFGAGFWDLTAGGARRGAEPRGLVDTSIAPVWEANHTWLIYCLVILWSAFPPAFSAIVTTLWLPLILAALGIVLRGAGFAFRKVSLRTPQRRLYGIAFAFSSLLTPYCFGSIAGALASGRVPARGYGDAVGSWTGPTSVLGGLLAVLTCAYLAAVYLMTSARHQGRPAMERYFRRRAVGAGGVTGLASLFGISVLRDDAPRLFHHLSGRGLPLLIVAALCGAVTVAALVLGLAFTGLRELAALAVAAVVAGWGVAQYPLLLGTHTPIGAAAAPTATLWVLMAVACAAGAIILPSLLFLYGLHERGRLEVHN